MRSPTHSKSEEIAWSKKITEQKQDKQAQKKEFAPSEAAG